MRKLFGSGAAPGCTDGFIKKYIPAAVLISPKKVEDTEKEAGQLTKAISDYKEYLQGLIATQINKEARDILETYLDIADDEEFFSGAYKLIKNDKFNASYALSLEKDAVVEAFAGLDDQYLKERALDIENVCREIIQHIQGVNSEKFFQEQAIAPEKNKKWIVLAQNLTPDVTLRMDSDLLAGFVAEQGGLTSHTVILARSLGIPAIVGVEGLLAEAKDGEPAIIYGDSGELVLSPIEEEKERFNKSKDSDHFLKYVYEKDIDMPAVTKDGVSVLACINLGEGGREKADKRRASLNYSDGVGLFRTEFIYMSSDRYPTEEEQFYHYRLVAEEAEGKEVIIRTLDIGGDKQAKYMKLPEEANPFLGFRAIRISLAKQDIFQTQLRAILRAGIFGNVKIMFPMITNLEELRQAKEAVDQAKASLDKEGIPYKRDIEVGIMIETPSAVLVCDQLAKESSFFSIGTNDLIQYTMAVDRMNERVQKLYNACNPSVLRSVQAICQGAAAAGIPVGMCGEAASDQLLIPIWIALGVKELSVVPSQLGRTKYTIRHVSIEKTKEVLPRVLNAPSISAVIKELKALAEIEMGGIM